MNWFQDDHAVGRAADAAYDYTAALGRRIKKWWADLRAGLRNPPKHRAMGHLL